MGQLGLALDGGMAGHAAKSAPSWARAAGQVPAAPQESATARLSDLEHPVTAYLNSLAPTSRRPQLSALDRIAHRSTHVFTAETIPWHRLRRPQVLKIRGLVEEDYQAATANRMLSALRGVLRECWQAHLLARCSSPGAFNARAVSWPASAPPPPGESAGSATSRPGSRPPLPTTSGGPGSGTCSTWASTWPPCRRWRAMPRLRRLRDTIDEIGRPSVALPLSSGPVRTKDVIVLPEVISLLGSAP